MVRLVIQQNGGLQIQPMALYLYQIILPHGHALQLLSITIKLA